jgi:hypothetical protein
MKMCYKFFCCEKGSKEPLTITSSKLHRMTDDDFWMRTWGDKVDPRDVYYYREDLADVMDFNSCHAGVPIVSTRVKERLETLKLPDVRFHPIRVEREDGGEEIKGLYLLDIQRVVECLDFKRTKHTKEKRGEKIHYSFTPPIYLKYRRIEDERMFRPAEYIVINVITKEVKNLFEKEKFTGVCFGEVGAV